MKKQIGYWTKENCTIAASKYLTKTDFRKENSGAYDKAWINNWLDDICSHMIDPTLTTFSEFVV